MYTRRTLKNICFTFLFYGYLLHGRSFNFLTIVKYILVVKMLHFVEKFSTLTQNVKSQIKDVSKMVKDLKKSIDSASGLNSNESQKRRSDVGDISKRVSSMKQMMTSEKTKEKVANDRRELLNSVTFLTFSVHK